MIRVKVSKKYIDYKIAKKIYSAEGKKLLDISEKLNETAIAVLKQNKIKYIYIEHEDFQNLKYDTEYFDEVEKINVLKRINCLHNFFKKYFIYEDGKIKFKGNIKLEAFKELIDSTTESLFKLFDKILPAGMFFEYMYPFPFEVNKILLNIFYGKLLVKNLNLSKKEIYIIIKTFLLMDCSFVPLSISEEKYYTDEECIQIKKHPELSAEIYKIINPDETEVISSILVHHEKNNGYGYPNKGNPSKISQVCSLADSYVQIRYNKKYRNMIDPILFMKNMNSTEYDSELINIFKKMLIPFPIGQLVFLNHQKTAVVLDIHDYGYYTPIVKIININNFNVPETHSLVDLSEKTCEYKITGYFW